MGTHCGGEKVDGKKTGAGPSGRLAEKRVGGGAVRCRLVAVRSDPGNLGLKQIDPLFEFGQ